MALDEVTRDELQAISAQSTEALSNHQQWHGALLRTLVCKLPSDRHYICPAAHTECRFGQWYYGKAAEKMHNHPGYIAMGEAHARLHHLAMLMLVTGDAGNPIATIDFDNLSNALERLRLEIFALERELGDSLYNRDAMTGAITRYSILPTLREQQELVKRHAQRCVVAMMDLDHFKSINDRHGHPAGDRVLATSVRYLIKHLRPDDKVFRYGGEEFLLCMPYTEMEAAHERVEELGEGIAAMEIEIGEDRPIHISASFGLALLASEIPVEGSIDRADKALYAAKSAGRNCVRIWDESM